MATIVKAPNRLMDSSVLEQTTRELVPLLKQAREDKFSLNMIAMRHWNIWAVRHDSAAYRGRLKAYLASGRRIIENWVSMLKRGLFPVSGKWFEVSARTVESEERAPTVQSVFQRELTEYMAIRRKSAPILRGEVILGTQPLDIGWRVSAREVPTIEEILGEAGSRSTRRLVETVRRVITYLGPTLRPVDFFRFYAWPTTVNDVRDLDVCFEDFLQDPRELERLSKVPILDGDTSLGFHIDPKQWKQARELIPRGDGNGDKFIAQRRRLAARGFRSPMARTDDPSTALDCEKGYWLVQFDGDDAPAWHEFIVAGDDIPLRMREIATGLQGDPSYVVPKFVEVWEEFWGYGLPTSFESVHHFLNDVFNQGGDALTWSLNPIAAIDPDAMNDHTVLQMKPGAKWMVRMPRQSIAWMEPPKESGQVALAAVGQLVALMNDVAGVQPFAPGGKTQGKGRSIDTLGGLQILASEGQLQSADVIQNNEDLWLNPMLRRMYDLNVHCLDEPLLLNVEGVRGAALIQTRVTRRDLIGEFELTWLASTYQYNSEVRTAQMSAFLQILGRIPQELFAADNIKVRIGEFCKILYEDGMMLPFASRVFQEVQPVRGVAPELENELFRQGRGEEVKVSPADDDAKHLQVNGLLLIDQTLPPEIRDLVMQHMQQHIISQQAKQMMLMQQQAMQAAGGGPGMMPNGDGAPPVPGQPGVGGNGQDRLAMPDAPGRLPTTTSIADIARRMPRPGGQGPGMM